MKEKRPVSLPAIGGSSLLVIFAVLCLTVFALLSLSTVLAEQRISQAAAQSVSDWYGADLHAQKIFAELRNGEIPSQVEKSGNIYSYTVPISENRFLEVALKKNDTGWEILSWQTISQPEEIQQTLPVWQGLE